MKLLIISLAGIGDTLFATPLIHELRLNFPDATIDAFVLWTGSKDVLEGNPHLNSVHQKNLIKATGSEALQYLWRLRKNQYDVSFNTHPQSRIHYRIVSRAIGASMRISHQYNGISVLDQFLVNRTIKQDYERHSIENNLALMRFIGAKPLQPQHHYEIFLSAEELEWADRFLENHGLAQSKLLGVHLGSGGTKNLALRRWPLSYYIELIQRITAARPELAVVLFGGPEEIKDHELLLSQTAGSRVFDAKTSNLRQAAALLKKCRAFLSVDTALMHLAATMKVPRQVVIETPTWNKPIEPYNNPFILVKNPAVAGRNLDYYKYDGRGIRGTDQQVIDSMASITVDSVFQALSENPR